LSSQLDERLRDGLAALAETVQPAMPRAALLAIEARGAQQSHRRGVRRPALVAFAVVMLVVGAVAGGAWWVTREDASEPRPAENPTLSRVPTCRDSDDLPCDPGDENLQLTEKVVVAEGERNGVGWQLLAYESEAGLCVGLRAGPGESGACGSGVPPLPISVGWGQQAGFAAIAKGFVRKDVTLVRLELSNGDTIETTPIGAEAGFEANFFVASLPEDSGLVRGIAIAADGRELGRQETHLTLSDTSAPVTENADPTPNQ
jgi:hypothetical protein